MVYGHLRMQSRQRWTHLTLTLYVFKKQKLHVRIVKHSRGNNRACMLGVPFVLQSFTMHAFPVDMCLLFCNRGPLG